MARVWSFLGIECEKGSGGEKRNIGEDALVPRALVSGLIRRVTQSAAYKGRIRRLVPSFARQISKVLAMKTVPRPDVVVSDELRERLVQEWSRDHQKFFDVFGLSHLTWDSVKRGL